MQLNERRRTTLTISNEEEWDEDLDIQVLFAEGSNAEIRTVPLNFGNRFHILYELDEQGHSLTIAGLPGQDTQEQLDLLSETVGLLSEYLTDSQFEAALRGRNGD